MSDFVSQFAKPDAAVRRASPSIQLAWMEASLAAKKEADQKLLADTAHAIGVLTGDIKPRQARMNAKKARDTIGTSLAVAHQDTKTGVVVSRFAQAVERTERLITESRVEPYRGKSAPHTQTIDT